MKPIPTRPSFCYITPISYLDAFARRSNRHLVLAHLVDKYPAYANFYKSCSDLGDYVMMDNGAYELHTPYDPDKLIDLAKKCGADAVVLPDYPFKPSSVTIEAAEKYIPLFKAEGFHTFYVPHSKTGDLNDWISGYMWGVSNPDVDIIGMSILSIPNAIPAVNPAYARVTMTAILQSAGIFDYNKHHHYLGLNAGPALEIPSLLRLEALTSADSSGPVWAGICGHAYTTEADSFQFVKKLKSVVDFNIPRTSDAETISRIDHNIRLTESLFSGDVAEETDTPWYAVDLPQE